jgi:thioredoxin reductase
MLTHDRFHCLFCHGYEDRGASSVGVLAIDDLAPAKMAMNISNNALRLSEKVVIYTNGNSAATEEVTDALSKLRPESKSRKNISVNGKKITKFIKGPKGAEVEVVLEGGEMKTEGFLVHKPVGELNGNWVGQLGLETTEQGQIKTKFPFNETSVPGVFAVGDCGTMMQAVTIAISAGGMAAAGIVAQLEAED